MVVARVKPLLFGGKFEDLTLACKACGFTKRHQDRAKLKPNRLPR